MKKILNILLTSLLFISFLFSHSRQEDEIYRLKIKISILEEKVQYLESLISKNSNVKGTYSKDWKNESNWRKLKKGFTDKNYASKAILNYASEARLLLKDVAAGAQTFSMIYSNETPTFEILRSKGFISPSPALMKKWKVEINGDIYTAISTQEMAGGAGESLIYDAANGTWSGYGEDVEVE